MNKVLLVSNEFDFLANATSHFQSYDLETVIASGPTTTRFCLEKDKENILLVIIEMPELNYDAKETVIAAHVHSKVGTRIVVISKNSDTLRKNAFQQNTNVELEWADNVFAIRGL